MQMSPPTDLPGSFDENLYLDIMRDNPPLRRYVSRGDTPDDVDIPGPHVNADRAIFRAVRFTMKDHMPRFQPILGSAGLGKTHLYWVLKEQEDYFAAGRFLVVYVPSPPSPVRVPLHLHACIVDEAGEELFEQAVDMLITKFGGVKGITHEVYDYTYALERLLVDYPGISSDVVKALLRYRLDPARKDLARRWLLGDALTDEDMERLGVRTVLEEDDVTMATVKLLAEGSEVPLVLFVDEMEGPYNTYGEEGERHFLEILKRLYNETKNVVIIASCLTDIWDRVYQIADAPMRSRMEAPVNLEPFDQEDVDSFVRSTMTKYWEQQNIEAPPDPLFPFTEDDIRRAFEESEGVPREAIKFFIPRLDEIVFGRVTEEVEPQEDYVVKLTATVMMNSIVSALQSAAESFGVELGLKMAPESQGQQATIVELVKDGVKKHLAIDLPNVKDWNRSGGVAAFYSVKRLKAALDEGKADVSVIAVPVPTSGTKFEAMAESLGEKILLLRFDVDSATEFVRSTADGSLPHGYSESIRGFIDGLFP
jgi:hypothetical protein